MQQAHERPTGSTCSSSTFEQVIAVLSRKWAAAVIDELRSGPLPHNALARALAIEHRQLDRPLRELVRRGLVQRRIYQQPIRVYYSLTARGAAVTAALRGLRSIVESDGF